MKDMPQEKQSANTGTNPMIDPEIVGRLARLNGETLPKCHKNLEPAYHTARELDLKILISAKDEKNRVIKKGLLMGITLFPILPLSQQTTVANAASSASRNAWAQVRLALAPYTAKVKQISRARRQWLSAIFTPLQRRLGQIHRSMLVK